MIYLLDTNVIRDLMELNPPTRSRFGAASAIGKVITCVIVVGEMRFGIENLAAGKKRTAIEQAATVIFGTLPCEAVPVAAADFYATIKESRQRLGSPIAENDLWIAATAIALGATLVTRDNDFKGTSGLTLEDWSK